MLTARSPIVVHDCSYCEGEVGMRYVKTGLLLVGCMLLLVACDYTDTAKAQGLCAQFEQLASSMDELQAEDPLTATSTQLRDKAQDVKTQLDEFQAVSEGRFDTALSTVRAEVNAIAQSAVEAGTEALDTARPQVEEALTNLADAWAFVQDLADTQCGAGT